MPCPFCLQVDPDEEGDEATCPLCRGEGDFECSGNADPTAFMETDDPSVYFDLAKFLLLGREHQWTPEEYLSQPAVFIQAFEACLSMLLRLIDENRERQRARLQEEMKRS